MSATHAPHAPHGGEPSLQSVHHHLARMHPSRRFWRRLGVIAAAAVLISLPFLIIGELPGERWLSAADARAPLFATLGVLLLAADVVLPVPSSAMGLMLGARLGFPLGFACCWLGLFVGHVIGYGLGRLAPERWAAGASSASSSGDASSSAAASPATSTAAASSRPSSPSVLAVFLTRPVPVLAEALAVSAGALRMPLHHFVASALLGDVIYAAVLAAAGAKLLSEGAYLWALGVPMALMAAAWAARRLLSR